MPQCCTQPWTCSTPWPLLGWATLLGGLTCWDQSHQPCCKLPITAPSEWRGGREGRGHYVGDADLLGSAASAVLQAFHYSA